jgi:hypothetical protein
MGVIFNPIVVSGGSASNVPYDVTLISSPTGAWPADVASLTISSGVTSIGINAFYNWTSATSLTIPSSVTSIGAYAFYRWTSCQAIYCYATTPPGIQSNTFLNLPSHCIIHVPTASLNAYESANYWSSLSSQMVGDL